MYRKLPDDSVSARVGMETRAATKKHMFEPTPPFRSPPTARPESSIFKWDQVQLRQCVVTPYPARAGAPREGRGDGGAADST